MEANPTHAKWALDADFRDGAEGVQVDFNEMPRSHEEFSDIFFVVHEPRVREKKQEYMSSIFSHDYTQFATEHSMIHHSLFRRSVSTTLGRPPTSTRQSSTTKDRHCRSQ